MIKIDRIDDSEIFDGSWLRDAFKTPEELARLEKFSETQPREPKGTDKRDSTGDRAGGQWTSEGGVAVAGDGRRNDALADALDSGLGQQDIEVLRGGHNNTTYLVDHEGETYFVKEFTHARWEDHDLYVESQAEIATRVVAEVMGMEDNVPPVWDISNDDVSRIAVPFIEGGRVWAEISYEERQRIVDAMSDDELTRFAIFDYVTGQRDRHPGNLMIVGQDDIKYIDNGLSFVHRGGVRHDPARAQNMPAEGLLYIADSSRVLSRDVMAEFVSKRSEIRAVLPDYLDPDGADERLDHVERLMEREVTVNQFWDMIIAGELSPSKPVEKYRGQPREPKGTDKRDSTGDRSGGQWTSEGVATAGGDLAAAIDGGLERQYSRGGHNNTTYLVDYEGETYFVKEIDFKYTEEDLFVESQAELATRAVAEIMGLEDYVLPVWDISNDEVSRIAMPYVEAATPWLELGPGMRKDIVRDMSDETLTRLAMFDYVTGQRDRHAGNILYRDIDGRDDIKFIDNGLSFVHRAGVRHDPQRAQFKPAHYLLKAADGRRTLSHGVMAEYVDRRADILAAIPDYLDPDAASDRLDHVERMMDEEITVGQFWKMIGSGELS